MSSKKCISLENFNSDNLVFGYAKEGEMSDGKNFRATDWPGRSRTPITKKWVLGVRHPKLKENPLFCN